MDEYEREQEMLLANTVRILSSGRHSSMQSGKKQRSRHSRQGLFTR